MSEITGIIEKHRGERGELIAILEDIQAKYSYLPEQALRTVADRTGRSLSDIYGIATFYRWFSLEPRGKHLLTCCVGTACHVRGAPMVAAELERELGVKAGRTTADRQFTFETQNCLGGCALGPIVVADGHYFAKVGAAMVPRIIEETAAGIGKVDVRGDERVFPVEVSCAHCNHALMHPDHPIDGYPSIKVTVASGDYHGPLLLSSLYGSSAIETDEEIPEGQVAQIFCPHCHAELSGAAPCVDCGAPMVPMIVRAGGIVQICSRRGCHNHMLDITGVNL